MTVRGPSAFRAAPLVAVLALSACSSDPHRGYSFTGSRPSDVHTIYVPIFANQTFYHGIEVQLTDAIIKEIQRGTHMTVTSSAAADTTLSGAISAVNLHALSTSASTGLVQEEALEMVIDFEWRDARTGKPLVARKDFRAVRTFVPELGTNERIELGEHAAVQELAHDIVGELRSNW